MHFENNIYKRPTTRVQGMSSRQQVLFLLQKTQKEANWDMENDSDFQEDYSQETTAQNHQYQIDQETITLKRKIIDNYSIPYNEEFEIKREKLRQQEFSVHRERLRCLAYSLTQFTPIKKNKYLERKRHLLLEKEANALLVCNCQRVSAKKNEKTHPLQSFNCGERCINRCVSTECCAQTCPSGPFCKNRRFQLHQNAHVYPAKTEKKGWGLFAGEFIPKGTFVMQYVGEVFSVDSDLGQQRVQQYKTSTCTYLMRTTNNEVIDPTKVGNIARFINHSCDPNCETQKWNVLGEVCVGIFALKDIRENEELSFDYQFDFFKTPYKKCYCGAAKCKGYLGVLSTNAVNDNNKEGGSMCSYCEDLITEKEELLICNGYCRETFHIGCIIKREGKNKAQAQALMASDRRNFVCSDCLQKFKKKRVSGIRSANANNISSSTNLENASSENPQEDKDKDEEMEIEREIEVPPWESKDPNIRKYFEDNDENRLLDKIIAREIEQIEQQFKEINDVNNNSSKVKRAKRKNGQFSEHYNFISELQKRLKMRIKENKKHYKFRKHKDDIQEMKKARLEQIQSQKQKKQEKLLARAGEEGNNGKRKRGRPRKIQSQSPSTFLLEKELNREKMKHIQLLKNRNIKSINDNDENLDKQMIRRNKEKDEDEEEEENDEIQDQEDDDDEEEEEESKRPESTIDDLLGDDDEDEEMNEDEPENDQSQSESLIDMNSNFEDEEDDDEEEDSDDEDEEAEQFEEEMNLEKLQGQLEAEEEEKQKQKSLSLSEDQIKKGSFNQLIENHKISESLLKKRLKEQQKTDQEAIFKEDLIKALGKSDNYQLSKKTPIKQVIQQSPRRNSLLMQGVSSYHKENQNKEKNLIQQYVRNQLEAFLQEQIKLQSTFTPSDLLVRESKINVYEIVFNFIIPENIDTLQCLPPAKFQIFWDQPWGGMVTVRLQSTLKQYIFITNLFQEVTDMLCKSNLLSGLRIDQQKDFRNSMPFEIVMLKVPKNFIRKLVGYQEKTLVQYRKHYAVDFDFNRDLLTDDVFWMNETAQLRIFGKNTDVYIVNELIHKELEQIKMKTILLQMNDCKLLMDNVKEVKVMVDPCEIRVKRMIRDWKDLRHPFYYLPNYSREMALIGTDKEIQYAESQIELFFQAKRDMMQGGNIQQLSFLLPIFFKNFSNDLKNNISQNCPNIQIFFYEPTYPRKHLTVLIIGPWQAITQAKAMLEEQANMYMIRSGQTFEGFQQFTYHQQIRFSFKSLKRFVLEHDIKYLNHWDLCSIFVEEAGKLSSYMDWSKILNSGSLIQDDILNSNQSLIHRSHSEQFNSTTLNYQPFTGTLFQQQFDHPLHSSSSYQGTSFEITPHNPNFLQQQQHQQQQFEAAQRAKKKDYEALVRFLKHEDVETCINSLFVLVDSKRAEQSMRTMMERLRIGKSELITNMITILQKNIEEYEESLRLFNSKYEPIKIIEQQDNDQEQLVISQNKDITNRRPYRSFHGSNYHQIYGQNLQKNSRSPSHHHNHYQQNEMNYQQNYTGYESRHSKEYQSIETHQKNENKDQVMQENIYERKNHSKSRSNSRSRSRSRNWDKSPYSSQISSRKSSIEERSYHRYKPRRRNHESPDFTRPGSIHQSRHYNQKDYSYRQKSPPQVGLMHQSSRQYYGYRDKYREESNYLHHRRSHHEHSRSHRSRSNKHHHHHSSRYHSRKSDSGEESSRGTKRKTSRKYHRDRENSNDSSSKRRHHRKHHHHHHHRSRYHSRRSNRGTSYSHSSDSRDPSRYRGGVNPPEEYKRDDDSSVMRERDQSSSYVSGQRVRTSRFDQHPYFQQYQKTHDQIQSSVNNNPSDNKQSFQAPNSSNSYHYERPKYRGGFDYRGEEKVTNDSHNRYNPEEQISNNFNQLSQNDIIKNEQQQQQQFQNQHLNLSQSKAKISNNEEGQI